MGRPPNESDRPQDLEGGEAWDRAHGASRDLASARTALAIATEQTEHYRLERNKLAAVAEKLSRDVETLTAEVKKEQDYAAHWKNACDIAAKGIDGLRAELVETRKERDAYHHAATVNAESGLKMVQKYDASVAEVQGLRAALEACVEWIGRDNLDDTDANAAWELGRAALKERA